MYKYADAAAAQRARVSFNQLHQALPTPSSFARRLGSHARLRAATRPSPFARRQPSGPPRRLGTPIVPDSLFPHTTAWAVKPDGSHKPTTAHRVVLVPNVERQPATTVLPTRGGMLCYVQVVNAPSADTPGAALMLHFDNRRYFFGRIAEGMQRSMMQRRVSLARIFDIFLTGAINWQATGGLLGMILTIADLKAASIADVAQLNDNRLNKGKKSVKSVTAHLNIHGGKNLVHLLATARRFILRKALPVHPREVRHDPRDDGSKAEPDYEDENIRVWSIPVSVPPVRPSPSEPQSPKKRKRSPSSEPQAAAAEQDPAASEEAHQTIREAVVKDMFNSKWDLDTLREMPLADVRLPAKIFVRNHQGHLEPYDGPGPNSPSCPDIKVWVRLPWPAARIEQLPPTSPAEQSMCYIVKCHSRRGKFNPEVATGLGVIKTDFKKLTAGQSVPGKDGTIVTPEMVMGDSVEGRGFAVLDIPFPSLVDPLLQRHEWSNPEVMAAIDTMYWILSDDITVSDPRVLQFMQAHASVKHVILGSAVCPNVPGLESPTAQLIKMNRIDKQRFHLPVFDLKPRSGLDKALGAVAELGRAGMRYQMAPKPAFLADKVVPVMDTGRPVWDLTVFAPEVLALAETASQNIQDPAFLAGIQKAQHDLPCPETEIIPLGTGSAMPSKYRNVSATLIRVPGWGNYMLDCGENTLGQLRRCFGYAGADEVLKDLRAIYISHVHADHHLGTVSIIDRWREVNTDGKLAIVATTKYLEFVREIQSVQALGGDRLVPVTLRWSAGRPIPGSRTTTTFPDGVDAAALRLPRFDACLVDHCFEATAVVLTFPGSGLRIAYSGDCRPSATFAELGRGAHLLLHECTFDDELAGDALAKKHSTLSEALDIGRRMRARRVLLTHFSQRYPKLPVVNEAAALAADGDGDGDGEGGKRDVAVLFAFDMMRVKLGEFRQAQQFLPALRKLLMVDEKLEGEGDGEEV